MNAISAIRDSARQRAVTWGKRLLAAFALLLCPLVAWTQTVTIPAELITSDSGMSSESIYSIFQDRSGFMWFGSSLGVARHDGLHYQVFRRANTLPNPLSNDYILAFAQGPDDSLWLATENGLNRFDATSETFTVFRHDPKNPRSLSSNSIFNLNAWKSRPGLLWVSTVNRGLGLFDIKTGTCLNFRAEPSRSGSLASDQARMVYEDSRQRLWVASAGGFQRFRPESQSFESFRHDPLDVNTIGDDNVYEIFESARRPGILWVGSGGNCLNRFDPDRGTWQRFTPPEVRLPDPLANRIYFISDHPDEQDALLVGTSNGLYWFNFVQGSWQRIVLQDQFRETGDPRDESINCVFHDRSGVCWVSINGRGLYKFLPQAAFFRLHLNGSAGVDPRLSNYVHAMAEGADGQIWLGTAGGLFRYAPVAGTYERFVLAAERPDSARFNRITRLCCTRRGELWIATIGGLVRFDPLSGEQEVFPAREGDAGTLGFTAVAAICDDSQGDVWIASDFCLLRWDSRRRAFTRYLHDAGDPGSLSASHVNPVLEDREGHVWIGTENGLNLYDRGRDKFTRFYLDPPDPSKETQNYIMFLHQDVRGRIWVGTSNGLNLMERGVAGVHFQHYSAPGSTVRNFILGIVEDDDDNLWISSSGGLSRFDTRTRTFTEYGSRDRFPSILPLYGSCLRLRSGEIFFGGLKGMVSFKPWLARINRYVPPLAFTGIQVWRRSLAIGGDSPLPRSILLAPDLVLSHKQNNLTVSFAALSFIHPEKNQYAYRLDGRDSSWHELGFDHAVTLDNLSPGRYRLRVRGANNEGVWNEAGIALRLRIRPPFWRTWWFTALVALVLLSISLQWNRTRTRRLAARIRTEAAMDHYCDRFHVSAREREIIQLLLKGKSNKEIEDALFISMGTVKNHVYRIFQKLEVKNRGQLIALFKNLQVK